MKPAIVTFSALLLLTGTASAQSQDPAGAPADTGSATLQTQPDAPKQPGVRPIDTGGLRDQLLQGAINTILRPRRPRPPPPAPLDTSLPVIATPIPAPPVILEPAPPAAPAAAQVEPVSPIQAAATPKVVPAAQPAPPPKAVEPPPTPRPTVVPVSAVPVSALPVEAAPTGTAPVAAAPVIAAAPTIGEVAPTPILAPQPATPMGLWLLLALMVAAVAAATAYARRARLISRTRAALSVHPSLDLMAGTCSASGLALAGPSLAIRARLDDGGARNV